MPGEETDKDLLLIFAPGYSPGGARPKASAIGQHGALSIAKFAKEVDDYSLERWQAVAFDMAAACGITVAQHDIVENEGRPIFLSRRFDRQGGLRIPFLSTQPRDGERTVI